MAEVKNPDLNNKHQLILRTMMKLPENKNCADCHAPYPRWASTNLGIFVCMPCSGIHRKLGTHISQVRSVTLDTWTAAQVAHFQKLGNKKAAAYFESCMPDDYHRPHASDTARMEAFIRDKYEHRRFITVENGGLGGAAVPSARASIGALSSQPAPRGRAAGRRAGYDDAPRTHRATASSSYAARFSSAPAPAPRTRQNTLGESRPSAPSSMSVGAPDALQRAATLKELVNMGFSTTIALRAVQASQGDLQRAVDWVLANSGGAGAEPAAAAPAKAAAPAAAPARDLLDFDDPPAASAAPATQPNGSAAANGTAQSAASTSSAKAAATTAPAKKVPAHFGDFGDFGDFASALPKSKAASAPLQTKPAATAAAAPATGLGALAELYKKGPAKASSPGRPASQPARNAGLPTQSPGTRPLSSGMQTAASKPISPLPGMARPGVSMGQKPISPLPGMARPGVSPNQKVAPAAIGMPTINIKRDPAAVVANAAKARSPQPPGVKSPPPPPPPMQDQAIVSDSAPPPPTTPPPGVNGKAAAESPTTAPAGENGAKPKVVKKEDEDPFAALSMMALSSAKPRKESKPKAPEPPVQAPAVTKAPTAQPVSPPAAKQVEAAVPAPASGAINLDDFFG